MKFRLILFTFFVNLSVVHSQAQDNRLKYFGIESGMNFIESKIADMKYIRGSMPVYFNGFSQDAITSFNYRFFLGAKAEIFSLNDRFGLQTGLRYVRDNSYIGKNDYFSDNTRYFYWLHSEDGLSTEYLRVREINQKVDYIGIPVEIRYFTQKRPRIFQIYFKVGIEISYLLKTNIDVVFENPAMDIYADDITNKLDEPGRLNVITYSGAGIKIGRDQKPSLNVEANLPLLYLNPEQKGITKPIYGGGFQICVQIPIKSNAQ